MPTSFGPYELLERLGEGGMAEVWSAKKRGSIGFERVVCIKRIRFDQRGDAEIAERFMREARVLGRLHHANIAQIYDAGKIDDEYFIEMEYLHGKDLRSFLKEQLVAGPPPPGLAISVATDIGRALDHAHRLLGPDGALTPIVHRDVTAANVMLGFDGSVKLVDFGLAKTPANADPRLTSTGVFVGTTGYIAPEVIRGDPANAKSDQYALGVVFYEALTCRRLLDASVARERPPSECNAEIPKAIDAVCLRALANDPMDRFSSCGSFVNAIDAAAPRLGIGATGIAALLKARFGGSKLESPATTVGPAVVVAAQPVVTAQPVVKPQPIVKAQPIAKPPSPAVSPSSKTVPITGAANRPAKGARSSTSLWLAAIGAGALLASAIVYRLREEPTVPIVATPSIVDAATPPDTPDAAVAERMEPPPAPKRVAKTSSDLIDPFASAPEKKQRKKKSSNSNPDDMELTKPMF